MIVMVSPFRLAVYIEKTFFVTFQIFASTINARQDDNYDVMVIYPQRS